jgi:hypothetical protein
MCVIANDQRDEAFAREQTVCGVKEQAGLGQDEAFDGSPAVESFDEPFEKAGHPEHVDRRCVNQDIGLPHLLVDPSRIIMRIEDTLEGIRRLALIAGTATFDLEFRQLHQSPASTCPFNTLPKALEDFMGGPVGTSQASIDGTYEHGNLFSQSRCLQPGLQQSPLAAQICRPPFPR